MMAKAPPKRMRAYCPECDWFLVKAKDGVWLDDKWFCHRCNKVCDANLKEVK